MDPELVVASSRIFAVLGAVIGASVTVMGGAKAIGNIGGKAVESIARQPEAGGRILTTLIIASAMIEGCTLFGLLICLLVALG